HRRLPARWRGSGGRCGRRACPRIGNPGRETTVRTSSCLILVLWRVGGCYGDRDRLAPGKTAEHQPVGQRRDNAKKMGFDRHPPTDGGGVGQRCAREQLVTYLTDQEEQAGQRDEIPTP